MQSSNTVECIIYVQLHIPGDPAECSGGECYSKNKSSLFVSIGRSMMMMIITTVITTLKDK